MISTTSFYEQAQRLSRCSEGLARDQRYRLARDLQRHINTNGPSWDAVQLIQVLCNDPNQDIRSLAADLICWLPEEELASFGKKMLQDSNHYVKKAAQRSLDRRAKEARAINEESKRQARMRRKLRKLGRQFGDETLRSIQEIIDYERDTLVGKLVHDLRGLVSLIQGRTSRLMDRADQSDLQPDQLNVSLDEILHSAKHVMRLTNDMETYAREITETPRPETAEIMIQEAMLMASDRLMQRDDFTQSNLDPIEFVVEVIAGCRAIHVPRERFVMALANLIENAVDAVLADPDNGVPRIEITARPMPRAKYKDLKISVSDNGIGIHPEMLDALKEGTPGLTSKRPHGTGFGVAIARRTVETYDGTLAIESEENGGTTVTIEMPIKRGKKETA